MKEVAELLTRQLSTIVEIVAALVIGIALIQVMFRYFKNLFTRDSELDNQEIRIQFGSSLTLSLELLLGADILATAVAPTWDDIGKLAAIAALRTILNFILERELKNSNLKESPFNQKEQ